MCGIIGYVGNKEIIPILLEGLHSLEYRGYDSSGIAIHEGNNLNVVKAAGKLNCLEEILKNNTGTKNGKNGHVNCGVGHTRWATHGEASDINAHPHFDRDEKIAVVHNGIIRNYQEVREKLLKAGVHFVSETDTEVIVQLISYNFKNSKSLLHAICTSVNELNGSFALGILFKQEPDKIYAVRKESPIIIGMGENENYLASDSATLSLFVSKIIRLGDNEIAEITKDKVKLYSFKGEEIKKSPQTVTKSNDFLDKKGFKHHLLKEISEQADVISNLLSNHLSATSKDKSARVRLDYINLNADF